jgi:hypothetical protein
MRIFDPLHSKPHRPGFGNELPATAGKRFVDRAEFIATKPHGDPPDGDLLKSAVGRRGMCRESLNSQTYCYNACPRGIMLNLTKAFRELKKERAEARRKLV